MEEKINIHKTFWYLVIFSIIGLIIETIYCYATTGIIESRKGLIWGPFCPVYGVGAALLMCTLGREENVSTIRLFLQGAVLGTIAEYILSYGLEAIYKIRFWDYGYTNFNINGRICLQYTFYWGVLSVILVKYIRPFIDKFVETEKNRTRNIIEIAIFIFLVIDCIFTVWGIKTYENRVVYNMINNIKTDNIIIKIQQNIENNYFTNERMSKTFPNLRMKNEKGEEVWISTLINQD